MSVRNASDVLSMAQVAEGALDESSKVLQRIRELAIQSASDLMNGEERLYLQTEANQLIAELDRVARDTTFNEIAVLDGTFADRRFQIGSKEREAATLSIGNLRTTAIGNHIVRTSAATGATVSATAVSLGSAATVADEDFTIHMMTEYKNNILTNDCKKNIKNFHSKIIIKAVNQYVKENL